MRDIDIRAVLHRYLEGRFRIDDPECVVRDELGLCQGSARIDVAVINGHLHGFEIKSEEDTLRRVISQLSVYSRVFDYLSFVTNEKHLSELKAAVPSWCGLFIAKKDRDGNIVLKEGRKAKLNKSIDPDSIVQLLWRDEAIQILCELGKSNGLLSKPRRVIWSALTKELNAQELSKRVRLTIKKRDYSRSVTRPLRDDATLLHVAK